AAIEARLLSLWLRRRLPEGERVGVLLPPCAAAALANVALTLEGRVPINLNYTASEELVAGCAEKAGARAVLTSRRFLEKLGWKEPPGAVFIEDAAAETSKTRAALAALSFWALPAFLLERRWCRPRRLDELATVIFTSGSTGVPKGVMLTQANVLANIEALGQILQVSDRDRILGILPFFHSFGFTVTLWFPLLAGFGAVYHHNPLDSRTIGDLASKYAATILLGTPTFLATYLRRVEPEKFKSLRMVVAGAEKLREEVARAFQERFGLRPLEGYGCTELSPVAAVNIPDFQPPGEPAPKQKGTKPGTIGQPLPGVVLGVVDPDTGVPLGPGRPGLILVKGPNVMAGYLGEPEKTAASMRDGFYVTGDIGMIDDDGFVTITDRLSRFSKIAGEMVPHIKVEEKLHELAGLVEQTFVVVGAPDPKRGERLVVLCKGCEDLDGLFKKLQASGLPNLWIPAREDFRRVDAFPLLGSGKLDMPKLKTLALEAAGA
ncbi:MAG TPA: AMP-binding protein, partial [Elusimicrobiota bacterium]|nr:AMP-binding protein [Elusimicrobiota bacterium]